MEKIESAVNWAVGIAADAAHGYDQTSRWGPDYDCSSLVISAWEQAGVPVKSSGATYTGNMKNVFLKCGFQNVTSKVTLSTGSGLAYGDVLLHEGNHTALYIGDGKIVHASINEKGGITGGQTGDQTGGEICTRSYYNYPWQVVLRYTADGESTSVTTIAAEGTYTVEYGDNLWNIAAKFLGDGTRYGEIIEANGLTSDYIQVGQVLIIPSSGGCQNAQKETFAETCQVTLPLVKNATTGISVRSVQVLLNMRGIAVSVDGDFGSETEAAVRLFQSSAKIVVDGEVGAETWAALIAQ